ncbi:hypothetical protein TD95_001030 [Thielaviopsis punctulata]|uniref:Zn(2)-C6 fungal-type domain-containing protein n=1 Tax=Thielaviopsis punctulata TaxID=72032 RepID=A0A0F4ZJI1_9PEZI|nr:hypothetical protein TD95_001030 [Thielaviopsis punctulata]
MVGVPGKYKGCETCRRRRVKCDNIRPVCRKCVTTGRHCEGYERQMIFITATPEDGGRCSSHPPRSTSKKFRSDAASIKSHGSASGSTSAGSSPSPSASTATAIATATPPMAVHQQQQLPLPPLPPTTQFPLPSPPISNGPVSLPNLSPGAPLRSAWDDALFLVDKHQAYYPTQIVSLQTRLAQVARGGSGLVSLPSYHVPDLRSVGADREYNVAGQCIVNVGDGNGMCVFLYEPNNYAASPDIAAWRSPQEYMGSVQASQPRAFCMFPAHHFFSRVYRPSTISWALLTRTPTHLAHRDWIELPWEYHPKSLADRLFDILAQLPALLQRADAIEAEAPNTARSLKIPEVFSHLLYIDRQLSAWCRTAAQSADDVHQHSYWMTQAGSDAASGLPFTKTFVFQDGATAVGFLFFWMASLLLGRSISALHRAYMQALQLNYGMYAVVPEELNIDLAQYQRDGMLATNICCALDFALSATAQPDLLIGPLTVADMYFKGLQATGSGAGQLETMWCEGFRRRMAAKGQHITGVVGSRAWTEYGAF